MTSSFRKPGLSLFISFSALTKRVRLADTHSAPVSPVQSPGPVRCPLAGQRTVARARKEKLRSQYYCCDFLHACFSIVKELVSMFALCYNK